MTPDLTDPRFWVRSDAHATVARLRRDTPVYWHEAGAEGPSWAVLSHRHSMEVLGNAEVYGSQGGSLLGSGPGVPAGSGRMMALSDPPRHGRIRNRVADFFSPRGLATLESRIRELAAGLIDEALDQEAIDFVPAIAGIIPMTVVCEVMAVPPADRPEVVRLCDSAFLSTAPAQRREAHQKLLSYLLELAMKRRIEPGDDLVSAFAADQGGTAPMSIEDAVLNCDNIIVGGVQTVRHTAAMSVLTLIRHPDLWHQLADGTADPRIAVEELLRWTSVGVHVLRTARTDTTLAGHQVRAGDRVVTWVPAANRDETVFDNPDTIDLARRPNRHLALGWGPHFCIGGALARMQLRVLIEELVSRVCLPEPAGPAVPALSLINLGLAELPVRLRARRSTA